MRETDKTKFNVLKNEFLILVSEKERIVYPFFPSHNISESLLNCNLFECFTLEV